jgi:trans-aconitate methyltransferase
LHIVPILIGVALVLFGVFYAIVKWKPKNTKDKIGMILSIILVGGMAITVPVLSGKDWYNDFKEIARHHTFQAEYGINSLCIKYFSRSRYYVLTNKKSQDIKMDIYHYKKLKKVQEKMPNAILQVSYLPNTKWLINYVVEK